MATGYEWQEESYELWRQTGYKGVMDCCPAAGKTRAGAICIKEYLIDHPFDKIWVVANTKDVLGQWKVELKDILDYVEFYTYPGAVSKLWKYERALELEKMRPDLLVLDECHFVMARMWGQVVEFGVPHLLGMSGTPSGSHKRIGPIFQKVTFNEANVAPTTLYMCAFTPSNAEMEKYRRISKTIETYKENHPYSNYKNDAFLSRFINQRRRIVNGFSTRFEPALRIALENKGKVMMIFCSTKAQADAFSAYLTDYEVPNVVYYSGKEKDLDKFMSGEIDVCISCRMLNTGFNKVDVEVGIIVATTTSPITTVQTASRMIRVDPNNPEKTAKIYYLLADGTNDMELYRITNNELKAFKLENRRM